MKIDRISGATSVADQAFGYLDEWLRRSKKRSLNFLLDGLENRGLELLRNYPAMGNIYHLLNGVGTAVDRSIGKRSGKADFVREIARQIKRWQQTELTVIQSIPKIAARAIGWGKTILTLSSSELVRQTFFALKQKKVKAIVLESRPLCEGEKTAYSLAQAGIPTTLIIDLAFPSFADEADVVLVGADRIGNTLVNKVGTRILLEWADSKKKPVFVVCQTSKFVPPSWCALPLPTAPSGEVSRLKHGKLEVRNFYFEEAPLDLVYFIITEQGVHNRKVSTKKMASVETSEWLRQLLKKAAKVNPAV